MTILHPTDSPDQPPADDTPQPPRTPLGLVTGGRRPTPVDTSQPILPEWLRVRGTFTSTVANWAKRNAYRGGKWSFHLPAILVVLVGCSPRGVVRLVKSLAQYLYDYDSASVRHHHAGNVETKEYLQAQSVRRSNLKARWMVASTALVALVAPALAWTSPGLLAALVGLTLAVWIVKAIPGRGLVELVVAAGAGLAVWRWLPDLLVLVPRPPDWLALVAAGLAVLALGWHGRPLGRQLVKSPTLGAGIVEPLKAPVVVSALCSLGNSKMNERTEADPRTAIRLLSDPHRHGPGVQIDLELPPGVPATFVMKNRESFAAALRRELGCVWPSRGERHPGHLELFVSDQPMSKAPQPPWPLMKSGEVDLFQPFPAFTDQRNRWVNVQLAYASMIIGAVPRMGKTFTVRELLLVAGLDKRAKVYAIDGKGTGDLAPCSLFAHFYSVGDEPEEIERVLHAMRALKEEMRRRTRVIREMPHEECPENKVTSVLASRKDLRLEPIVVGFDETQVYFEDAPEAIKKELSSLVTDLVKRGPALGIMLILATQTVNKDTIPTGVSNNAVLRFCLKMTGWEPNDRVLGTGSYNRGVDASMFDINDKGIGYLKADDSDAVICRSVWGLDAVQAEKVARRARQLRIDAGRLSGDANDEESANEAFEVDLREDVRFVMQSHRALLLGEIREGLALLRPGIWGHLDNAALGAMLNQAGIKRATVYSPVSKSEGYGVKAEWLDVSTTANVTGDEAPEPSEDDEPLREVRPGQTRLGLVTGQYLSDERSRRSEGR